MMMTGIITVRVSFQWERIENLDKSSGEAIELFENAVKWHKRVTHLIVFSFLVVLLSLGIASVSLAYDEQVEIVPLGEYPDTALPPGKASCEVWETNQWSYSQYQFTLEARAFTGWVFLGWEYDDAFRGDKAEYHTGKYQDSEGEYWHTSFEIVTDRALPYLEFKAIYAYIGPGSAYYELSKMMNPVIVETPKGGTTYPVDVYERDPVSVDGDYGTIFCYPFDFKNNMDIPAGAAILFAALPKDGYQFDCWRVFKEGQNGFDESTSNVLLLIVDAKISMDAIFRALTKQFFN